MKLHSQVQNEAVLSNVGEIGEFRIRNSAKAFNILSSGLYANKIRAIVRELSCNAVDSHVAAGRADTPFDVHLPNQLEPHFSIRDYGTGLSHEQVTNIYTTYFESTKTGSNDFIGALGLGSKSPFSYTDNFTVTAVKDGRKGIYTAFINEQGVPSIALMMEEQTADPAGVEIKFSVNDRYDFNKFRDEARSVYKYFSLKPNVTGATGFEIPEVEYETENIIPGVHSLKDSKTSIAIMGNIAYPIQIPEADKSLGDLRGLINCGLEMHFAIGELDFQASREGLSYIPQTVEAIKRKLEQVNTALTVVLAREADAVDNLWSRAVFLQSKSEKNLWNSAAIKYAIDSKLSTVEISYGRVNPNSFSCKVEDLAKEFNIVVRGFIQSRSSSTMSRLKEQRVHSEQKNSSGIYDTINQWKFTVANNCLFIINDTKVGVLERAKTHFKSQKIKHYTQNVYVLEPAVRGVAVKLAEFFAALKNPPQEQQILASSLDLAERAQGMSRNVSIMQLEECYNRRGRNLEVVWRDAGKFSDFDSNKTYYYVPLSGYQMISSKGYTSGKDLLQDITSVPGIFSGTLYGVRKSDIETIQLQKNWVNVEEHVSQQMNSINLNKILLGLVRAGLENTDIFIYNNKEIVKLIDSSSPYAKFVNQFVDIDKPIHQTYTIERLFAKFVPNAKLNITNLVDKHQSELGAINKRYPLLTSLSSYRVNAGHIAEYISLIDGKKETV
jgi:hypothetical protein